MTAGTDRYNGIVIMTERKRNMEKKTKKRKWIRAIVIWIAAVILFRFFKSGRRREPDEESD